MRVFQRQFLFYIVQRQHRKQFLGAVADRIARHEVNAADERQILACRQVVEKSEIFGNDSHMAFSVERLFWVAHVFTQDEHPTARRSEQAGQHFDRRGLAGTVGAEETVKRPPFDCQVNAADGAEIVEIPRQLVGFNR